jgi:hypothetical protein
MNSPLMPRLQAAAAAVILALLCFMVAGPMCGLNPPDTAFVELEKAIVLILVGFLFGTSVSSGKKDAALTALAAAPEPEQPK